MNRLPFPTDIPPHPFGAPELLGEPNDENFPGEFQGFLHCGGEMEKIVLHFKHGNGQAAPQKSGDREVTIR